MMRKFIAFQFNDIVIKPPIGKYFTYYPFTVFNKVVKLNMKESVFFRKKGVYTFTKLNKRLSAFCFVFPPASIGALAASL